MCQGMMEFRKEGMMGEDIYKCNSCGKIVFSNEFKGERCKNNRNEDI